jgi:nucleotide-binding universal stress UspA family protein
MVAHGMAAEEIVRVAKEMQCDVIVLGMHDDQGWLANLFHANVADEVKYSAPCCVMAVNGAPTATPATL